jgi:hypothetical protein
MCLILAQIKFFLKGLTIFVKKKRPVEALLPLQKKAALEKLVTNNSSN